MMMLICNLLFCLYVGFFAICIYRYINASSEYNNNNTKIHANTCCKYRIAGSTWQKQQSAMRKKDITFKRYEYVYEWLSVVVAALCVYCFFFTDIYYFCLYNKIPADSSYKQ